MKRGKSYYGGKGYYIVRFPPGEKLLYSQFSRGKSYYGGKATIQHRHKLHDGSRTVHILRLDLSQDIQHIQFHLDDIIIIICAISNIDVILSKYSIFVINWWLCSLNFLLSSIVHPSRFRFFSSKILLITLIMAVLLSSNFFTSSSLAFSTADILSSMTRNFSRHRGMFSFFIFRHNIGVSLWRFFAMSETKGYLKTEKRKKNEKKRKETERKKTKRKQGEKQRKETKKNETQKNENKIVRKETKQKKKKRKEKT